MGLNGNERGYDLTEVVLEKNEIPTYAELTGWALGGNQNTIRYAGINQSDQTVNRLAAYR